jgi:hypothetical protein
MDGHDLDRKTLWIATLRFKAHLCNAVAGAEAKAGSSRTLGAFRPARRLQGFFDDQQQQEQQVKIREYQDTPLSPVPSCILDNGACVSAAAS